MNHLFKRSLSLIVAVVMVLVMIPANPVHVHAEDAVTVAEATVGFHVTTEGLLFDYTSVGSNVGYYLDKTDKVAVRLGASGYANLKISDNTRNLLLADNNKVTVKLEVLTKYSTYFQFKYVDTNGAVKTLTTPQYTLPGASDSIIAVYELSDAGFNGTINGSGEAFGIAQTGSNYAYVRSLEITPGHCEHTATSTDCASVAKTCTKCGVTEYKLSGHTYTAKYAQAPTCTDAGWHNHYYCAVCDKYFDTEKNEVAKETVVRPALGHKAGDENLIQYNAADPTCTKTGNYLCYNCTTCGKWFNSKGNETTQEALIIPATGHNYTYTTDGSGVCGNCGGTTTCAHKEYDTVTVAPTCTTAGGKIYTCKTCGGERKEKTSDALGHSYEGAEWVVGETTHWKECTREDCNEKGEEAEHSFQYDANGNGICECGATDTLTEIKVSTLEQLQDALASESTLPIVVTDTIVIPEGETVVLDLNGKTVSQTKEQTAGYQMILNDGTLTINDSVGGGKISYTDSGNGGEYISDTIYNRGHLVINGGAIENWSNETVACNGYPHAVDTYSGLRDTSVTINDGEIYCNQYSAIRMFCVSATNKADLIINGGTISGSVDMQNGTAAAALGSLTVKDGNFVTRANTNNIRFANWNGGATTYGITASIEGGTFNGAISTAYVPAAANWNSKIVSGGTFSTDVSEFVAEGYELQNNGDGTFGVAENPAYGAVAMVNGEYYKTVQAALTAAIEAGASEVKILTDVREVMESDFDLVIGADLTITADAPVNVEFYNEGTKRDFATGSADGNAYVLTIDENVTFNLTDRVIWLGYYDNLVTVNVKGTLAAYNMWVGTDTTVTGTLISESAELVMRRDATLTVNGGKVDADFFQIYSGHIVADNADIDCGLVWVNGNHNYASEGTFSMSLKNGTTFDSNGEIKIITNDDWDVTVELDSTSSINATKIISTDKIIVDAAGLTAGASVGINADMSGFTGTLEVVNNDNLEAKIENGQIVLVEKVYVAVVEGIKYETLVEAVEAVEDGGTITLIANETFTAENRTYNSGTWYDGLYYIGDKSFTIDLGGFTIGQDGAVNDYLLNFKNDGTKANTITIKNGTVDAGTTAYCAICTSSTSTQQITINLENVNIINNNSNGSTIKVRGGAVLNVKDGTVITGEDSYLGIECVASTVNIYDGAEIYMNGISSYNGCLVGACSGGTVNVYGGYGKGAKGGFIAMTSGGTINVFGGEWIANNDGTVGNNSNVYVLTAQNNKTESGYVGASIINVTGGTFRGGMDAWILTDAAVEKAELNISGGSFSVEISEEYCAEGFLPTVNADGTYGVKKGTIKVTYADGTEEYFDDMREAVPHTTNYDKLEGATITLLDDMAGLGMRFMENGMVFDLNGHTYTLTGGTGSKGTETSAFQIRPEVTETATIKNGTIKLAEGVNICWIFNSYATDFIVEDVTVDCTNMAWSYGESCYVHVSRFGDNTQFIGTTKVENFNSEVAGAAINVGGTMTIGENVVPGGSIELDAGATLTAPAGLTVVTGEGYKVVYENGTYSTKSTVHEVSTKAELNAALAAAEDGDTIVLAAGIDYGTDQLKITNAITLDLGGYTLTTRNAYGGMSVKGGATVKNGTIVHASNTAAIKVWNAAAFEDLVIDVQGKGDANKTIGGIVLQEGSTTHVGSIQNVTIQGAALTNGIETYNCGNAEDPVIDSLDNVTINAIGTAMLISAPVNTANNCTFTGGQNAIELWIKGSYNASLNLNSCTVVGGVYAHDEFKDGVVNSGTLQLTVGGSTTGAAPEDITLTIMHESKVEGVLEEVMTNAQAKVNDTYYLSVQDAVNAAKDGDTVTLLKDIAEDITVTQKANVNFTIDGNDKTMAGSITVDGKSGTIMTAGLTIQNVNFAAESLSTDAFINLGVEGNTNTRYVCNLTVEGCTFTGNENIVAIKSYTGGDKNLTVTDCTATGLHSLIQVKNVEGLSVTGGSVTGGKNGISVGNSSAVTIDGITIEATGYGVRADGNIASDLSVKNANITAEQPIVVRKATAAGYKLDLANNTLDGDQYAVTFTTGDDGTYVAPSVKLDITGAEDLSVFPVYVASIGDTYYTSLAEAIAATQDSNTVKLLDNIQLAETVTIEKAITLDLGGKILTGADGAIVLNVKAATTIENGTIKGNKSGTSSGLIDIYADLNLDGVTIETSKIYALRFKAGDCTATLTNCDVTGAFKGFGGSVWNIVSGTYKASSTAISDQLNGTAAVSGGTFHYAIDEVDCAPGYVVVDNGDGTYGVKYAPAAFVDANNNGVLDDGEAVYGNLDQVFANHKSGDVYVVLTDDVVANGKVDTTANAHYYFTTNVAEGVTMDFLFADDWNYIQKASIGENITLNAKYLLAWTELDVYGTINTDYAYFLGADVVVREGAVLNANTGDATVQVKDNTKLTVNGTVNTAILNVWKNNAELVVSGENAKVNASWIDIWDGTPSVTVENGATLEVTEIKASRGGSITVADATLTSESIELGHNGESTGTLTVTGNSTVSQIKLTVIGSTVTGPEGLDVVSGVDTHFVTCSNGVYSLTETVAQNATTGKCYASLDEAMAEANSGETVKLMKDGETKALLMIPAGVTLNLNGHTITAGNVFSFGNVIDNDGTTDGLGGIIVSNDRTKAFVQLQTNNTYMPLYDTANGCYRFFEYTLAVTKVKDVTASSATFSMRLKLSTKEAYKLLAESESGVSLSFTVSWTGMDESITYTVSGDVMSEYGKACYDQVDSGDKTAMSINKTIELKLKGIDVLQSGTTISIGFVAESDTGVGFVKAPIQNVTTVTI